MGQDAGVGWSAVPTPFGADLEAVTHAADGPYAAGEDGILAASAGPSDWEPVIEQGALEADGDLLAVDTTREGERVWFAGDSGVLGMFDTETGGAVGYDYTGRSSATWTDLAVTGPAGGERALLANDAGAVVSFDLEGEELSFSEPTRPTGAEIVSLATTADGVGYAVDADGAVSTATPTGWESLGTIDTEGEPTDIAATEDRLSVSATDGHLYERPDGGDWSSTPVADESILAVAADEQETVALAPDATFYTRPAGESSWERGTAETSDRLTALALGPVDVAVGENGAVVERGSNADGEETEEESDPDLPPVEDGDQSEAETGETPDDVAAIEDAENAIDDVDAAAEDAANVADGAVEDAVEAIENAAADAQAAIEDAANAAETTDATESMDEHTELVVEELLSRAETEDLVELLRVDAASDREFAEKVAELVEGGERHAHECDCVHECTCGSAHEHGTHQHEHHHHHEHGGHHGSRHKHGSHHHKHGGHDCC